MLDMQAEQCPSPEDLKRRLAEYPAAPSFVGITATAAIIRNAHEVAGICRSVFPAAKIVMGGVHPTVMPDECLDSPFVDYVVRGEGELTMLELCGGAGVETIAGLSYRNGAEHVHNPQRPLIEDLDSLPFPAYHLLPMRRYHPAVGGYRRLPSISMITTRGCPGRCTFCFGDYLGRKVRRHSVGYIVEQIKMLKDRFGIREISFYDDTFTVYREQVRDFCHTLIDQQIDITWVCFARVDFADEETLRLMKKAGCHQILFGIESGSDAILKNIGKHTSVQKAREAVGMAMRTGLDVRTSYMFGNPGETAESLEATFALARELNTDLVSFNITTPYPGSGMYAWAEQNGYLRTKDWEKYDLSRPVMDLPTVSTELVQRYYNEAHRRYYGRMSFVLRRLLKIRTCNDVKNAAMAALAVWSK
jgi:radical SAM superfamily enzyme YgiQ (UPF0313 family)